jgi:hypothetical protein
MDTKFWGPSGWRFLHTITFTYDPAKQKAAMADFLETLPYVLPCKFCRASLTDYYEVDLYSKALDSSNALSRWLYRIHNRVNGKLRDQGQTIPKDPTFREVREQYKFVLDAPGPRQCESFPGWDFLFSIAYNHPLIVKGSPMPDTPPDAYKGNMAEKNRWNILPAAERFKVWRRFWDLLPAVMPASWAKAWTSANQVATLKDRRSAVAWLWRVRCGFSHGADPYRVVCGRLASYESGCSTSTRAKTCRRVRRHKGQIKTRRK